MPALLLAFLVALGGLVGLVAGSFLNSVAHRAPAGLPLTWGSRCPHCDLPVPWRQNVPIASWVARRGACARSGSPIPARCPIIEALTGVAFAGVTWLVLASSPSASASGRVWAGGGGMAATLVILVASLFFAAVSIVLTLIDLDTHRLPNAIVLPSYPIAIALFAVACVLGADWSSLLRALAGMAALYAFYFALRLIRPAGMGGGDVKLAGVVGLYLGWIGWGALAAGAFAAFLLGGIFGVALLVARRADRRTAIPFGPFMLAGAWIGILAGIVVGDLLGVLAGS